MAMQSLTGRNDGHDNNSSVVWQIKFNERAAALGPARHGASGTVGTALSLRQKYSASGKQHFFIQL